MLASSVLNKTYLRARKQSTDLKQVSVLIKCYGSMLAQFYFRPAYPELENVNEEITCEE